jgi:poly(3-hydroxybutyrate) depolymerase
MRRKLFSAETVSARPLVACLLLLLFISLPACGESGEGAGSDTDATLTDAGILADQAPEPDTVSPFPSDPLADLQKVSSSPDIYWGYSTFGDGKGMLLLWVHPGYTSSKAWPLVVFLHGGGDTTDNQQSQITALSRLKFLVAADNADQFIWLAAILRVSGSYHAWVMKQNTLDMVDAIREVARRFHVDHHRVYLSGASMGGGGVASISWMIPSAFAAYGPVAGYYWNSWCKVPDLAGVPYRVVHGALDKYPQEPFNRLALAEEFGKLCTAAGADVEKVILPGVGHVYPDSEVPKMNTFFLAHTKETATDWAQVRADVQAFTTSP